MCLFFFLKNFEGNAIKPITKIQEQPAEAAEHCTQKRYKQYRDYKANESGSWAVVKIYGYNFKQRQKAFQN